MSKSKQSTKNQVKVLDLKFVRNAKKGKYGNVERTSLKYSRLGDDTDFIDTEEEGYYFGLS